MRNISILFTILLTQTLLFSSYTYVPDDNFEQKLINLGYDTGPLDDTVPIPRALALGGMDFARAQRAF